MLTQGIPDALFRSSVTYTPQQGPPNPALLASRPERIVQRYLADYLTLAGTFPCLADLSQYGKDQDTVLGGQPCGVTRPVASYIVTSVTIRTHGLTGLPEAIVSFVVSYRGGQQWANAMYLVPNQYLGIPLTSFHRDCWASADTLEMFGVLVPDIPPGAEYGPLGGTSYSCKPASG